MDINEQLKILKRGAADIISEEELFAKLRVSREKNRPLRVKLGIDASASDIHLGSAIVLYKLREFQDLGHKAFFLIGDFTGTIGDPSGQSKTRKPLSEEQAKDNAKSLQKQIFKILNPKKTKIVFNGSWYKKMNFTDVIKLTSHYTVARLLERDDFEKRYNNGQPIGVHELLYPLIQGYDSVILRADIEICGTDQRFNSLIARAFQQAYNQEPEVVIMMPILEGLGTKEKMSKTLGNYVGIMDSPEEMFGKIMNITDDQIENYFMLCTRLNKKEIGEIQDSLKGDLKKKKERLAYEIVKLYHGEQLAENAGRIFELKHGKRGRELKSKLTESESVKKKITQIAEEKKIPRNQMKNDKIWICKLLKFIKATESNSEAKRLIQQRAVKINGKIITEINYELATKKDGYLIEVGKRRIYNILFNR